jgi:hypothetical protein
MRQAKMSATTKTVEGGGLALENSSSIKPLVVNCSKPPVSISDLRDHEQLVVLTHAVCVHRNTREAGSRWFNTQFFEQFCSIRDGVRRNPSPYVWCCLDVWETEKVIERDNM